MSAEIIELAWASQLRERDRVALDGDPADVLRVETRGADLVLLVRYLDTRSEGLVIRRSGRAAGSEAMS
jgi:hypothetical protein